MSSRSKGNRNERRACELLHKWTRRKFARTPSSGGLSWKTQNTKGDVVCIKEGHYFPFCVEVKAHREINFSHLLYDVDAKIMEFWDQCVGDAKRAKKIPMLLMRYDRLPSDLFFLGIPTAFYKELYWDQMHINRRIEYSNKKLDLPAVTFVSSRAFFNGDYKSIKKKALNYIKSQKHESKRK